MRIRNLLLAGAVAVTALSVATTPALAQEDPVATVPVPGPRIVGGTQADPGEYPFAAALIRRGESRTGGFMCGGSVISRSWILTAAHCVLDYGLDYPDGTYGPYVAPSHFDVLTGTSDLTTGGDRIPVVGITVHPSYDPVYSDWDVALLRLGAPTDAPEVAVIGTSAAEQALDDAGVLATTIGWGVTAEDGNIATKLREVDIPVMSSAACASYYPLGQVIDLSPYEYHSSNMVCAGYPQGGKDSCQGDSGGALLAPAGGDTWRAIGLVSFGYGCARAGYPGLYHRLSSTTSWVGKVRRFGPFAPDGTAYIDRQYRDFAGRPATGSELALWRSALASAPAADIITYLQASAGWDGNAGMNTRLYRAAFGRNPDTGGLGYWVGQRWAGRGPVSIANHFTASSEFAAKYGALSNAAFIDLIYDNVFDRDPDPGGASYWASKLASGVGRGQMLYELSNSSEYRRDTATDVRIITTRFGLLRQVPSAGELTASKALSQRSLIDTLRTSYRYASRFAVGT